MFGTRSRLLLLAGTALVGLVAAACSNAGASSDGGSANPSVRIAFPVNGAHVAEPFTVRLESSVPFGDPGTGEHHVHVCFDGQSCDQERNLVFGGSCEVTDLGPGRHTIEASLRNADHSAAGPTDTVTVNVMPGSAAGTGMGSCTESDATAGAGGGRGY